jgi:DNA-binding transcriptional ArsR family regulator
MILCSLLEGERSVGELVEKIGLSQSALSQHLARLRRDGLVRTRRSSQTIYYRVAGVEAQAVLETLHRLYCGHDERRAPAYPAHLPLTPRPEAAQIPIA